MTYYAHDYATHDDACQTAETLEQFGLKPTVIGPIRTTVFGDVGEIEHWQVCCVTPIGPQEPAPPADYDPDEYGHGRSTLWDDSYERRLEHGD